jgi:methionyl aminopeptidase
MIQRHANTVDLEAARAAAQQVVEIHRRLSDWLHIGVTLAQIDTFVADQLRDLSSKSCFLHYKLPKLPPFPSFACLSPNDCIVHGTAGMTTDPMKPGDLISIDLGVHFRGWIGDAAWTYVFGEPTELQRRLMDCGKESLRRGIAQLKPGNTIRDFATAVQGHVEDECGFHLTRGLCGHGVGRKLHLPPNVPNTLDECPPFMPAIQPGLLIAVEPMIAVSTPDKLDRPRQWPIYTADGSLAVHYEHDVYVSNTGPVVLTEGLDELPDVIER